jgi:lipopolysaccharide/colanic/teichoic acid biosynthesis glycosyltransferase
MPPAVDYPLKRALDLSLASLALVMLSPLLGVLYLVIWWRLGRPVVFLQQRPGLHGQPFTLYKFRTMHPIDDPEGEILPDEARLSPLGRWLRTTSLDELPELVNIWRGEMSWVGPRPLLMRYLPRYTPQQARRHAAKPGLTGWAQIHGRNAISWEDRFALDVWYVAHCSLRLDLYILWRTVGLVLRREGTAPMPEFLGTQDD